ncbi:MAG: hypothetical protein HC916_17265 [Coleofasciculaceae cyanobacterium SM2_1_6]|nr:hypothetical protein [Coleofasciculaceae cyanobacterium SM2_1_6]
MCAILISFFLKKTGNTVQRAAGKRKIRVFIDSHSSSIKHLSSIYRVFIEHLVADISPSKDFLSWYKSYP